MRTALVWFQQDLRLADNAALQHAVEAFDIVIPVYLWTPKEHGDWTPGAAARWWIHHSLTSLDGDLRAKRSRLIVRRGDTALSLLRSLIAETGAEAVTWNARYEPELRTRDRAVFDALRTDGISSHVQVGRILHDPGRIRTKSGDPYRVFTPFWKRIQDLVDVEPALPKPRLGESRAPGVWPQSLAIDALELLPTPRRADRLDSAWAPGERAAQRRLRVFVDVALNNYEDDRNRPDRDGSARLSPHLSHGELSPRQIWNAVAASVRDGATKRAADGFLRAIAWREFAYHLLFHHPQTTHQPLRDDFRDFPWRSSDDALRAWSEGKTGYPMVDAGMRQLSSSGWMHNRVRMIVASFLTKDLLLSWQDGARWFWDNLVDADLANNTLGWQWTAGCGADAQPFFRIFNPVSQGLKFDPEGEYVRAWVPELAPFPGALAHTPWAAARSQGGTAPGDIPLDEHEADVLRADSGSASTYPARIVDHALARRRALAAWEIVRD